MKYKFFLATTLLTFALLFNTTTVSAQFQTFPTPKTSMSGERVKTSNTKKQMRNSKRYIENNNKKKKIKTGRKFIKNQSCSNFNFFYSEKTNRRQKTLARQRKRIG